MDGLDRAAHIVQLALTPIFLLTGIASLLNVFSQRLGRISDRVDLLSSRAGDDSKELLRLRLRSQLLDVAVLLGAIAGGLTCGAALALFTAVLRDRQDASILYWLFGGALACAIAALLVFAVETILAGRSLRNKTHSGSDTRGT
jgi:integral membrane sensor domain MASE1